MARISVVNVADGYRITLEGRLAASDLRRLERACGYALEHKLVPVEIDVGKVRSIDDAARSYLERLRARGARVYGDRELPGVVGHE